MDAEAAANSVLYTVLLCLLGAFMGATLAFLVVPYQRWVRRQRASLPSITRMWFALFFFGVGVPLCIIPAYIAGVTPGLPSDLTEGNLFLLVYLAGFSATLTALHYRSRRRRRSGRTRS